MSRTGALGSLVAAAAAACWACAPGGGIPAPRHVVIVSLDALGAAHTGAYGYERDTTPHFDRLASEGTLFTTAYTPQVWTLSAHLSLLTGVYPQVHGASEQRSARPGAVSLAQILARRGFHTAAFTGIDAYMNPRFGLGRGFDVYETGHADAARDNAPRLRWLEAQSQRLATDPDHRFFLLAHYFDAHSDVGTAVPYQVPPPWGRMFLPDDLAWGRSGDTQLLIDLQRRDAVTDEDRRVLTALYDGGVRYADERGLGVLVERLRALDLLESTLLVVTADHGEELFEHGRGSHQQPYEETARVPLVLRGPGIPAGHRVEGLVSLIDVMPTALSLLGLPVPEHVQGVDLSPTLRGAPVPRRAVYVDGIFGGLPYNRGRHPSAVIAEVDGGRWSYVNTVGNVEAAEGRRFVTRRPGELYDLVADPGQRDDLRTRHPERAGRLRADLLRWYAENDALGSGLGMASGAPTSLPPGERERLEALGYVD